VRVGRLLWWRVLRRSKRWMWCNKERCMIWGWMYGMFTRFTKWRIGVGILGFDRRMGGMAGNGWAYYAYTWERYGRMDEWMR